MKYIELQNNALLITVTNHENNIIYISDDVMKYSAFAKNELIGKNQLAFIHEDVPKEIVKEIIEVTSSEKVWKGYLKYSAKNGYYWCYTIISKIVMHDMSCNYLNISTKPTYDEVENYISKKAYKGFK